MYYVSVKEENQSVEMLFDQQFAQHSMGSHGRTLVPQSLLMAQSHGNQSVMLTHPQSLQETPLHPPFLTSHSGLVGHQGFNPFSGLPPPSGLTVFPGLSAQQGFSGFPRLQEYQTNMLAQQHAMSTSQDMQQEFQKNPLFTGTGQIAQGGESQSIGIQENQMMQQFSQADARG